jgi:hypothetical protein
MDPLAVHCGARRRWLIALLVILVAGLVPRLVEPQQMQSPTRYLVPDNRDFFAVFRRIPGPVTVPFR